MADNTGRVLKIKSIDGDRRFNDIKVIIHNRLTLVVTKEITGYTCQNIYGRSVDSSLYNSIVVPTYKLDLEWNGDVIASYNVTRDSWYSRGLVDDSGAVKKLELSNRCFEPVEDVINFYSIVTTSYPCEGLEAFALRENNSQKLQAVPHTKRMETFVDGQSIDGARKNPGIATGVMIHIGGWYKNDDKLKLAGSYGCFAVIPKVQVSKTQEEANKLRINSGYEKYEPSNESYNKMIKYILKKANGRDINVSIIKRENVETIRVLVEI